MKQITLICLILVSALSAKAQSKTALWNHKLWLGGGGLWESRCSITVQNTGAKRHEGAVIAVRIGSAPGELPLAGAELASLRVVNSDNVQLLFNLWQPDLAAPLKNTAIPEGAVLALPLVCEAQGTARFTVYFNNQSAWPLAEYLAERPPLPLNGDFEVGESSPAGWEQSNMAPQHELSLSMESPASGKRCIQQVARPGLEPSWSGYYRSGLGVTSGATGSIKVKVRTKDLVGHAGWYLHIGNTERSQMFNQQASTGEAEKEWQELTIPFTVPEGATTLKTGSLLRGSGTAWFDDLRIECNPPIVIQPKVELSCSAVEHLSLKREGVQEEWIAPPAGVRHWSFRFPVNIVPAAPSLAGAATLLAALDTDAVTRGIQAPIFTLTFNGATVDTCRVDKNLIFQVAAKPETLQTFYLYVADSGQGGKSAEIASSVLGSNIPSDQLALRGVGPTDFKAWEKLLHSPLNMLKNPEFESGANLPDEWTASTANHPDVRQHRREGALFGKYCVETEIAKSAEGGWHGWRQNVAVQPGATYLFGGWMETENFGATGQLHAHLLPGKGNQMNTLFLSAGQPVSGTTAWTPMLSLITIPHGYEIFSLHLTSNSTGTMRHDGFLIAQCLPALVGAPQTKPQQEDLILWQANPVVKVFKETLPPAKPGAIEIHLARNESEPLQLALRSGKDDGDMQVVITPPISQTGAALNNITVGRVDYVPIDAKSCYSNLRTPEWEFKFPSQSSGSDGWPGWWPDPIVPTNSFALRANQSQPLWITFDTDNKTPAGKYHGQIQILSKGKPVLTQPYAVTVWNFGIPRHPEFPAIYDIRFKSLDFSLWKNPQEAYEKLLRFMSQKKLSPDTVQASIPLKRGQEGGLSCDFTEYDKACRLYFDELQFRVSYMPQNFYLFGWGHPPKKFLGEEPYEGAYPYSDVDRSQLRPEYKRVYQEALKLYWEHLKAMGRADKFVLYISDEPHFDEKPIVTQMQALCAMIHEVDPAIRIYSSTWRHCEGWDDAIDVWGVGHYGCFAVEEMQRQRKLNNEIWFTTDGQMCTDTPLLAVERMLPHYAFKYNADAYEFWGVSWYTYNPWEFGWHSYINQSSTPGEHYFVRYPNGDGYLIYPPMAELGESREPVTSIRIEAARDGVEDFCYLKLLQELADRHNDQVARKVLEEFLSFSKIPNAGGRYSSANLSDPERMIQLRVEMGAAIERLLAAPFTN
ncbi:MAG: DUF4091 domain-containing protein [Kiritimatiellae bacterium]|nr:DUF4091 domain-containing protein [Kiritimatiellia bacterium]